MEDGAQPAFCVIIQKGLLGSEEKAFRKYIFKFRERAVRCFVPLIQLLAGIKVED